MKHLWAFIGALYLAVGIGMGAYGAHGLRTLVQAPRLIESFEYAVLYQLISGLGFFAIAWALGHFRGWLVNVGGLLLLLGSLGFSLSLYLQVLLNFKLFPYVTPVSGGLMIASWTVVAVAALTSKPFQSSWHS
jgi:uncharacterized membrane protein YgdD (TMEM256/DUF423 family)